MKKIATATLSSIILGALTFNTAFAFSDVENGQAEAINALYDRGVVSGVDHQHFAPKNKISYAQTVQIIVKGLDLNLDLLRFVKKPVASDYFTNIPNDAWYADAFIIAHYNGVEIPKDVNPNAAITREQFGDLLIRALEKKGNFPMIKIAPADIKDADQITPEYQGALQRMLVYKIAALDNNGKLNPKAELTRGEAATWVYNASKVLAAHTQKPAPTESIAVNVEKVNDDVNKVTLSRESKPTGGYAIEITGIQFQQDGRAIITYTLTDPQPDSMNAQVITEPKAVTYVSSKYTAVAEPASK
ncbi:S-layer homology domain-containing protein [Paenibacillus planticolens]|uniref:Protease complex subunit PrcB family protein n=1 Tax=Paenibacillus planticolens TaxID=2654976 RepID=A0ABX1ZTC1_9BACL|nr:S-layer homology domain-containing protein [Paenibacillus planticolens]NOV02073.1 protease complex subunit PrcB family protein [Paenibacillus planticolens]